jgi:hypothetical protein
MRVLCDRGIDDPRQLVHRKRSISFGRSNSRAEPSRRA